MEYYTRNFYTNILPYNIIDDFTIYNEAASFNEEFYEYLLSIRKTEMMTLSHNSYNINVFTQTYAASAVKLLSILPTYIQIPDIRVFLLYGVSREVYKQIQNEKNEQDILIQTKRNIINERYNHDSKLVPKHWLDMYNIQWEDAILDTIEYRHHDIILNICDSYKDEYTIQLIDADVVLKEEEIERSLIIFVETLLKDSKLELNILTYFNEFTIKAHDIIVTKLGGN
jgi:hypothetical protein